MFIYSKSNDNLIFRVVSKGHHLTRPSLQIGRYKMVRIFHHQSSQADPNRLVDVYKKNNPGLIENH